MNWIWMSFSPLSNTFSSSVYIDYLSPGYRMQYKPTAFSFLLSGLPSSSFSPLFFLVTDPTAHILETYTATSSTGSARTGKALFGICSRGVH